MNKPEYRYYKRVWRKGHLDQYEEISKCWKDETTGINYHVLRTSTTPNDNIDGQLTEKSLTNSRFTEKITKEEANRICKEWYRKMQNG